MTLINTILHRAAQFTREHVAERATTWRWATVTRTNPVKIRYDGPGGESLISPTVLATPVGVGDRVRVASHKGVTQVWKAAPAGTGVQVLASGTAGVSEPVEAGGQTVVDVTFPQPLPTVEQVMVTMLGTNRLLPRVIASSLTAGGCQVQLRNVSSGSTASISFWWVALG